MSRFMRGLLIKDFKLLRSQMKFFAVVMVLWGVFMSVNFRVSFFVGYVAVLCSFLTLSTINFDEYEKGMAFLFTLPILRKDYITEKYVFGFLITALPTILAASLSYTVSTVRGVDTGVGEYLLSIAVSVAAGYLFLAVEMPLQIRFGQEKSRIISGLLVGIAGGGMAIIGLIYDYAGAGIVEELSAVTRLRDTVLILLAALVIAVFVCVSYRVSCRFMEKREF